MRCISEKVKVKGKLMISGAAGRKNGVKIASQFRNKEKDLFIIMKPNEKWEV